MKNENWETANNTIGVNKCINIHLLFNKINKIRVLNIVELSISAFGLFMSLRSNILSALEEQYN